MKHLLIILLILVASQCYSQSKVTINFQKDTPADYDLLMNAILNHNGFESSINYSNHNKHKVGYTIEYYFNYGMTHRFDLFLNNKMVNRVSVKTFLPVTTKKLSKILGELLDKKMQLGDEILQSKFAQSITNPNIKKLDSSSYFIIINGGSFSSAQELEDQFKQTGRLLSDGFAYFCVVDKYYYNDNLNYSHKGKRVFGMVIKNNTQTITKLEEKPSNLKLE